MHPTLPIKQSLLILLISFAAPVGAINLGDLQTQSYLGQRFKGSVNYQLSPSETSLADCITVSPGSGDVPYIGSSDVQIRAKGDGNSGTIVISSNQSIGEPVVALKLSIQCGNQQLSREFTVFLDPAPDIAAPAQFSPKESIHTETLKLHPVVKSPTAKKDTTLADVAARYYPVDSAQYQKYLNRLKRANPDVATTETVISAGSPLFVPPRPKLAPAKIVNDAPRQETGQLRLEDADAINKPPSAPLNAQQNPEAYAKALEEKIVTLTELKKRLQLELADLDLKMAQMQLATRNAAAVNSASAIAPVQLASVVAVANPVATPLKQVASVVQAAVVPVRVKSEAESSGWPWAWLLLGVGGAGGLLLWRRKAQQQADRWANEDINDGVDLNRSIMSIIQAKVSHTIAKSPNTVMSLFGTNPKSQTGFELKEELDDHLDQAQYYLAQGETLKAIDLLYAAIDDVPDDTERWLMLFRVFRQQMMKTEYGALAHRFKALHKDEGDWELIRSIGNKLDPENPLFIRNIERAPIKSAEPYEHFDAGMAAAAPVAIEIVPDFTGAPVLPDFEPDPVIEPNSTADASLMDFLVTENESEEEPPRLPEVEKHRHV